MLAHKSVLPTINQEVTGLSPLKIGVALSSFNLPLRQAIDAAARLGVAGVELDARGELRPSAMTGTAVRQLRKLLSDANLKVCSVSFITRRGYNELDELDRRIAATKDAMRMAYELGATIVVNRVGHVPAQPEGTSWEILVETLSDLGRHSDRVGATLAARTGSEDGAALARLIEALPQGGVGVDFDPGGLIVHGYSPSESLAALGPHVLQMRARDGVRDMAQGRGLETPLGRGMADFPTLVGMLEDYAYRGYLTIERQQAADPVAEIGSAIKFLRNLY